MVVSPKYFLVLGLQYSGHEGQNFKLRILNIEHHSMDITVSLVGCKFKGGPFKDFLYIYKHLFS